MAVALVSPFGSPAIADVVPAYVSRSEVRSLAVHLLDNGKWNANHLFSGIARDLELRVGRVTRSKKYHYSVVAGTNELDRLAASTGLVITGVGDCGSCTSCSVHDTVELERRGTPVVLLSTTNFMEESRLQATLLGMDAIRIVEIEHPIASRTKEHMEDLGERIATACLELVVAGGDPA
jgi:hypothetical protein